MNNKEFEQSKNISVADENRVFARGIRDVIIKVTTASAVVGLVIGLCLGAFLAYLS